jgi:hypothetical protein
MEGRTAPQLDQGVLEEIEIMGIRKETTVVRTCDVCNKSGTFVEGKVTPDQIKEFAGWFVLTCEHLIKEDQLIPIAKLACSKACALQVLHRNLLDLPKANFTDPIDAPAEVVDIQAVN